MDSLPDPDRQSRSLITGNPRRVVSLEGPDIQAVTDKINATNREAARAREAALDYTPPTDPAPVPAPHRGGRPNSTAQRNREIATKHDAGATRKALALEYGLSYSTIKGILQAMRR